MARPFSNPEDDRPVRLLHSYATEQAQKSADHRSHFTKRERQVIHLVACGLTQEEIGKQLYITVSTVKSHLTRAYLRLNLPAHRRTSAVLISEAFRIGLLRWDNDHLILRVD